VQARIAKLGDDLQSSLALEAELHWIKVYTERWLAEWCPRDRDGRNTWPLLHDGLLCQLQLSVRIARERRTLTESLNHQRDLLKLSVRIFNEALQVPQATHMSHRASILPFVAAIILKLSDRRDLVLRLALRMAGSPDRPNVPTWVHKAGCQMIAMLW
jgi:hypothetical protein